MGSSFQKQSRTRKLAYTGAIALLFTLTLLWRSVVDAQADALDLREQNLGEAELTGSVVRLMLTGSRGFVVSGMWWKWNDAQKRQEWNQLERLTSGITKLQPHFRTPWLFHAWHLAYNVSVECDRVNDKYFYISRGIQLVAEGERQNRNNPDFRFEVGWMLHDKLGSSDEQNVLRCLFQLSCIPPPDRDPQRLLGPDDKVDLVKFQKFCEAHPFLVRRLRDHLHCQTPQDVVDFLKDNSDIPSRYEADGRLKVPTDQFPPLPRRENLGKLSGYAADDYTLPDDFDNFQAAQIWMLYSQVPMPPRNPVTGDTDYDRARYRMPRRMAPIIFRGYPGLMQTREAERLQVEGWFDRGWVVDEGLLGADRWFPGKKVVVGGHRNWSAEAWTKARELWTEHGRQTGLYLSPEELAQKEAQAQKYRTAYEVARNEFGPEPRVSDQSEEMMASFAAHRQLFRNRSDRQVTNFAHFHNQAKVEATPEAILARRLFYEAQRKTSEPKQALDLYHRGFAEWKKVLDGADEFRRDHDVQEDTYALQYKYLQLARDHQGSRLKRLLVVQDLLTQAAARPPMVPGWLPPAHLIRASRLPPDISGPLDGNGPDGEPYFSPEAIRRARSRADLGKPASKR